VRTAAALLPLLLLAGCLGSDAPPVTPAPTSDTLIGLWTSRADMPTPRTEVTCVATGDDLYALGGFDATNIATSLFHRYNSTNDAWVQLASFPTGIHHTGLVVHEGRILAFGGYAGNFPFVGTRTIFAYDSTTNAWSLLDTLPRARGAHATITVGSLVFLVGGAPNQPGQETYANVDVYNLTTGTFQVGPPMAAPREHLAGASARGVAVAVGGRQMSLSNFATTEIVTPGQTAWSKAADMPTARGGIAATAWGSSVFVFGGEASDGTFDEVESYDVATGMWTAWEPMPLARHGLCAVALGDGIHVVGGGPQPGLSTSGRHDVLSFRGK
jgi:hypothetical protein